MDQLRKRFDQLTWPEARNAASRPGATVIWPFGACEQHGPHLPLSTDAVFAESILDSVLLGLDPALPLWRLPCQALGFSPEHKNFSGTLSLSAPLILELVDQVGMQLAAMGMQRLVLFNAHGGQIGLLQVAARQLRPAARRWLFFHASFGVVWKGWLICFQKRSCSMACMPAKPKPA